MTTVTRNVTYRKVSLQTWFRTHPTFIDGMRDKDRNRYPKARTLESNVGLAEGYEAGRQFRTIAPWVTTRDVIKCINAKFWPEEVAQPLSEFLTDWTSMTSRRS